MLALGAYLLIVSQIVITAPLRGSELATVDGESITREQLIRELNVEPERGDDLISHPHTRKQVLDHAVANRLLAKVAIRKGVEKTRAFDELLAEARTRILAQLYLQQYIEENTTKAHLLDYFTKDPARFSNKEVRAAHMILTSEDLAQTVLKEALRPGTDFGSLARIYSNGASAQRGGDLGFFGRGHMEAAFEAAAFSTPKGHVHPQIVRTAYGFHIIKVLDTRGSDETRFEDVEDTVHEELARELRSTLVATLRGQAKIQILDKTLQGELPLMEASGSGPIDAKKTAKLRSLDKRSPARP